MDPELNLRHGFWGLSRRLVVSRSETVWACQTPRLTPDKVSLDCVTMLKKIGERHDNCVLQPAIVSAILDLFGVKITTVDSAGNVSDCNLFVCL